MATRVFDEIMFCEQFLKRTFQGSFLPNLVEIGPVVKDMMLLTPHDYTMQGHTTDNGHRVTLKAPLELVLFVQDNNDKGETILKARITYTSKLLQGPYSPTILKNILCLFLQDL